MEAWSLWRLRYTLVVLGERDDPMKLTQKRVMQMEHFADRTLCSALCDARRCRYRLMAKEREISLDRSMSSEDATIFHNRTCIGQRLQVRHVAFFGTNQLFKLLTPFARSLSRGFVNDGSLSLA